MTNTIKFTDNNGWTAIIEANKNIELARQIVAMCKTIEDVQRCAAMGDFRIVSYDIPSA